MSTTVADLTSITSIAAEDLLHILDASVSNADHKTTVDDLADWILANKTILVSSIANVAGLQAALDLKSDVGHTHSISEVIGLQNALDVKLDATQANISGRIINIKGVTVTIPSVAGGVIDDRIPASTTIGEYLRFVGTDGAIEEVTTTQVKTDLGITNVDNTSDANKPVSTATQTALDLKGDGLSYIGSTLNLLSGTDVLSSVTITSGAGTVDLAVTRAADSITVTNSAGTDAVLLEVTSSLAGLQSPDDYNKLAGIEVNADVTDTENVYSSVGINNLTGSTSDFLNRRGQWITPMTSVTKSSVDAAIGSGTNTTDYYASDKTWKVIPTGGGDVTKAAVDAAIGAFPTGNSGQFYSEQGQFIDVNYDTVENAPVIRNATVETITIAGTRTNVQVPASGTNEFSTITMQNTFVPTPTQYTSTFTSPNTTFTPALVFPAGSQGRQLSLTEADGTLHRFCYLVNGNYRLLDGGLTGTVRLGPVAVATTATVTAAVTIPDQTAGQTITLTGDETGTFSVGDFISPQANNFGAFRGIFVDSITFDGTNTVIVGPSNGATTFNTTSVLRNAGPATEIQGTESSYSYDPDTADAVYSTSVTNQTWTGSNITDYLTQVANSIAALDAAITWDSVVTDNGDGTSSILIDLGTETNIDSSFSIALGTNNMESVVNTDGVPGVGNTVATTVTVIDPEGTEVSSQTFGVSDAADNNVDAVGNFINDAVNNNTESPIDFISEYGSGVLTLQAQEAGNTNPWTIVFNNNGATAANAGNLSTSSVQTGEQINQMDVLSVIDGTTTLLSVSPRLGGVLSSEAFAIVLNSDNFIAADRNGVGYFRGGVNNIIFNNDFDDKDFIINKQGSGVALTYDAGTDTLTADSATTVVGFGGGGTSTTVLGTTGEIDVNTVTDTATVSLSSTITDAIDANTAKVGITTAQATAITNNTAKTGITTAQAGAITANTAKVSFPGFGTTSTTALTGDTNETGTWTPTFTFAGTQGTTTARYTKAGTTVVVTCEVELAAFFLASRFSIVSTSLPFTPTNTTSLAIGTYFMAAAATNLSGISSGIVYASAGTDMYIVDSTTSIPLTGDNLLGYLSFTITYETT